MDKSVIGTVITLSYANNITERHTADVMKLINSIENSISDREGLKISISSDFEEKNRVHHTIFVNRKLDAEIDEEWENGCTYFGYVKDEEHYKEIVNYMMKAALKIEHSSKGPKYIFRTERVNKCKRRFKTIRPIWTVITKTEKSLNELEKKVAALEVPAQEQPLDLKNVLESFILRVSSGAIVSEKETLILPEIIQELVKMNSTPL